MIEWGFNEVLYLLYLTVGSKCQMAVRGGGRGRGWTEADWNGIFNLLEVHRGDHRGYISLSPCSYIYCLLVHFSDFSMDRNEA